MGERILERWSAFASVQGRSGSQIEMLILRSLAADAQSMVARAVSSLQQALLLAEAGHYCRLFVNEGPPIKRLLHLAQPQWKKHADSAYLARLIQALPGTPVDHSLPSSADPTLPLLEPLSPREYTVLRLLAAQLSTREIADELTVSLNTIKTQLKSVYRKLHVASRQEALSCARRWRLL